MKIGIISDSHDNLPNLKKALEWIKKENIKLVLHCGDISNQETIDFANKIFKKEIKYVKGNADHNLDLPGSMELEVEGHPPSPGASARQSKIAFAHFPDIAKKLAQSGKFDLVFYGHTHRPWDEKVACLPAGRETCHMINPGEIAGHFCKPSFAVYDTASGKLELKILENL